MQKTVHTEADPSRHTQLRGSKAPRGASEASARGANGLFGLHSSLVELMWFSKNQEISHKNPKYLVAFEDPSEN